MRLLNGYILIELIDQKKNLGNFEIDVKDRVKMIGKVLEKSQDCIEEDVKIGSTVIFEPYMEETVYTNEGTFIFLHESNIWAVL